VDRLNDIAEEQHPPRRANHRNQETDQRQHAGDHKREAVDMAQRAA
jgi:hypothetical protein